MATQKIGVVYGVTGGTWCNIYSLSGVLEARVNVSATQDNGTIFNTYTVNNTTNIDKTFLPTQPDSPPGSQRFDLSQTLASPLSLAAGFLSDGQQNIWADNGLAPTILWGQHSYGTESPGTPNPRQANTLVQWKNTGGIWMLANNIYPPGVIGGVTYDFMSPLLSSAENPKRVFVFAQPNTNTDTHAIMAGATYDFVTGAQLNFAVIDNTQANSVFVGGQPASRCGNRTNDYVAYFHSDPQPHPSDYPNVHWFNRVKLSDLSVVSSQTPTAAGAPSPWDGTTNPQPLLTFTNGISAISDSGQWAVWIDHSQGLSSPNSYPYVIWDANANTIKYKQSMAGIPGFVSGNYLPIPVGGGAMATAWDGNDKLWVTIERTDFNFDLLRFGLAAGDLTQEFAVTIDTGGSSPVSFGNSPTLLIMSGDVIPPPAPSKSAGQTIVIVPRMRRFGPVNEHLRE